MSQTLEETNSQLKALYNQDFYHWIQTTLKNIRNQNLNSLLEWIEWLLPIFKNLYNSKCFK
jgi:hypothetical protein